MTRLLVTLWFIEEAHAFVFFIENRNLRHFECISFRVKSSGLLGSVSIEVWEVNQVVQVCPVTGSSSFYCTLA